MAPLRRYLRVTRHSVLEVRIYLDNPSDVHRWLLQSSSSALSRIIAAVRPLVLPKLQEEREAAVQAKTKGGKKAKGWKDTVTGDDFEVNVFLTEGGCRHAIMSREKRVKGEGKAGGLGRRVGGKMTGGTSNEPVEVGDEDVSERPMEDTEEVSVTLADIPQAVSDEEGSEALFVSDDEEGERSGRSSNKFAAGAHSVGADDKKKLAFATTYDGFSIYGRILCLVVKRKGGPTKEKEQSRGAGQARMEEWISSTQMGDGTMIED